MTALCTIRRTRINPGLSGGSVQDMCGVAAALRLTADQLAKMGRPAQILIDSDWLCAGCVPDLRLRRSLERCPHSPELPLLSRGQLLSKDHEWDQAAEAYLLTLSLIGKPAPLGQWNNIRVGGVQGERAWRQRKEMESGSPGILAPLRHETHRRKTRSEARSCLTVVTDRLFRRIGRSGSSTRHSGCSHARRFSFRAR